METAQDEPLTTVVTPNQDRIHDSIAHGSLGKQGREKQMSNEGKFSIHDEGKRMGSGTSFGASVESQAQLNDAVAEASPSIAEGEVLNLYRLEPIAKPDDPRWDNSPPGGVVLVAARTTGDARIVAAGRELDFMEVDAAPAEDVTTLHASAFRSEKLYTVIEVDHGRRDLKRGVVQGDIRVDTIRPMQV